MKLYVNPISSNARRPRMVVRLTGIPVEQVVVDLSKRAQFAPEYLAINPNHKVPALADGDLFLWESGAICQYLAAKAGNTDLWPTDPAGQADVSRWMFWTHTQWAPPISGVNFERLFKKMFGMGEGDEAVAQQKLKEFANEARTLDAHLASRTWLAQGRLTLADIQVACSLTYAPMAGMSVAEFPNVQAWFDRVRALPAWQETDLPKPG